MLRGFFFFLVLFFWRDIHASPKTKKTKRENGKENEVSDHLWALLKVFKMWSYWWCGGVQVCNVGSTGCVEVFVSEAARLCAALHIWCRSGRGFGSTDSQSGKTSSLNISGRFTGDSMKQRWVWKRERRQSLTIEWVCVCVCVICVTGCNWVGFKMRLLASGWASCDGQHVLVTQLQVSHRIRKAVLFISFNFVLLIFAFLKTPSSYFR